MQEEQSSVLVHVGRNLREARQAAGLSQAALATRSGISRRTIVNLEAGEANISLTGVDHLAQALGTTFTALVTAPGAPPTAIDEVAWRGADPASLAVLRAAVPARAETQLWTWTLGAGERYDATPDPDGWHEVILVTAGTLHLERSTTDATALGAGQHVAFPTAQAYAYVNRSESDPVSFIRLVVN